jgi:hypothetical protein
MAGNATLTEILAILSVALNALSTIPAIGADAALANVFLTIIQKAMAAYTAASGAPLDLSKIPIEAPVA